ncbi:MAG TPA: hypothetical protein VNR36_02965 [Pseudolysinimonas sp.]|nr:hypothetical protein [Pseudolysinimonas sp.]
MPETAAPAPSPARPAWLFGRTELIIVILLGLVSLATAYASFEASLYGGIQQSSYTKGNNLETEAESLYLEANQQYTQDAQTIQQLAVLRVAADAGDPVAKAQLEELYFVAVSEDLDAAIQNAAALDESDAGFYHDPQADEDYQSALFGAYGEKSAEGEALIAAGDEANSLGDKLTLSTVLMAITLFLLGVAAVIRRPRSQVIIAAIGVVIFLGAAAIALTVPFVWL